MTLPAWATEAIEVSRATSPATVEHGEKTEDAERETIPMRATIEPAGERELQRLPDGDGTEGAIKVFTDDALYATREDEELPPDIIIRNGEKWKVRIVDHYPYGDQANYESVATYMGKAV